MADGDSPTLSQEMWGGGTTPPPAITTPQITPAPQAPPNNQVSPAGTTSQAEIDQQKAFVEEKMKAAESLHKEVEETQKQVAQARQAYIDSITNSKVDSEIPQSYGDINQQPQQIQNAAIQVNQTWPAIVGLGLAIAGMFGKHHGAGITQGYFLGGMMQGYAQGKQQQMKDMRDNWWKQVQYQHQLVEERIAHYREALQEKRFTEYQKAQIVNSYANNYKDLRMMEASERNDGYAMHKIVLDEQKANDRYMHEAHKTMGAIDFLMKGTTQYKDYAYAASMNFFNKHGHLPATEEEQKEALKDFPSMDKWEAEHELKYGPVDPKTGKPTIVPKYPGAPQGQHLFDPNSKIYGGPGAGQPQGQQYDKSIDQSVDDMGDLFEK